jgi:hypothetical protein
LCPLLPEQRRHQVVLARVIGHRQTLRDRHGLLTVLLDSIHEAGSLGDFGGWQA